MDQQSVNTAVAIVSFFAAAIPAVLVVGWVEGMNRGWFRPPKRVRAVIEAAGEPPTLADKIGKASRLSRELAATNSEIQAEIELQRIETARLAGVAEDARRDAALNEEAATAARALIASELGSNRRAERRFQWILVGVGFVAGIASSLIASWILASMSGA